MRYQRMNFGEKEKRITLIHMSKPMSNGLGGMVISKIFSDNIPIIVDNKPDEECGYDFACFAWGKNGSVPRIKMSRELYYDIKRGKTYARLILLHELGHYFGNDHLITKEDRDEERVKIALKCEVSEEEIKADLFAAEYIGLESVIEGLNCISTLLQKKYDEPNDDLTIVLNEIKTRKKELQKAKSL